MPYCPRLGGKMGEHAQEQLSKEVFAHLHHKKAKADKEKAAADKAKAVREKAVAAVDKVKVLNEGTKCTQYTGAPPPLSPPYTHAMQPERVVTHAQLQQRYLELHAYCLGIKNAHYALIDELAGVIPREGAVYALAFLSGALAMGVNVNVGNQALRTEIEQRDGMREAFRGALAPINTSPHFLGRPTHAAEALQLASDSSNSTVKRLGAVCALGLACSTPTGIAAIASRAGSDYAFNWYGSYKRCNELRSLFEITAEHEHLQFGEKVRVLLQGYHPSHPVNVQTSTSEANHKKYLKLQDDAHEYCRLMNWEDEHQNSLRDFPSIKEISNEVWRNGIN